MLFEADYAGSKGTHLGRFDRENIPLGPGPGALQLRRPFPELGTIFQRKHIANSSYNSLQLKVEKRFTHALSFVASYVWSKSIDDADSILAGFFDSAGAQNENNLRLERGSPVECPAPHQRRGLCIICRAQKPSGRCSTAGR